MEINLSGINFANLEDHDILDPDDGVVAEHEEEACDDDDKVDGSTTPEGPENAFGANFMAIESNTDLSIHLSRMYLPFPCF